MSRFFRNGDGDDDDDDDQESFVDDLDLGDVKEEKKADQGFGIGFGLGLGIKSKTGFFRTGSNNDDDAGDDSDTAMDTSMDESDTKRSSSKHKKIDTTNIDFSGHAGFSSLTTVSDVRAAADHQQRLQAAKGIDPRSSGRLLVSMPPARSQMRVEPRRNPVPVQSNTTINVRANPRIQENRKATPSDKQLAPLSERLETYIIPRGAWLMTPGGVQSSRNAGSQAKIPEIEVSSCANGLSEDVYMVFAGQATNTNNSMTEKNTNGHILPSIIHGLTSGYHTGPGSIPVNGFFGISSQPYVFTDAKGNKTPAVHIQGTDKDTYWYSTFHIAEPNVGVAAQRIIDLLYDANATYNGNEEQLVDYMKQTVNNYFQVNSYGLETQPMHCFASWVAISAMLSASRGMKFCHFTAANPDVHSNVAAKTLAPIGEWAAEIWTTQKQITKRILPINVAQRLNLPSKQDDEFTQLCHGWSSSSRFTSTGSTQATRLKWFEDMRVHAEAQKAVCLSNQLQYLREKIAGRSVSGARGTGQSHDAMIGYLV